MKYSFISYGSSNITPGAPADYDLFTRDGRVAVTKGEPLSPAIAGLLRSHSLFRLCADLSVQTDVYRNSKLFESKDYLAAELAVEESLHSLERHEGIDLRALQRHDPYTFRHSLNVGRLSYLIGKHINLPDLVLEQIVLGALLHDIGKLTVPADLLKKTGRLLPEEYVLIKTHPINGFLKLQEVDLPAEVTRIVQQHHERWNGQGYPLGLQGEQIHLYAQIVGIADVFDALTSARSYRPAIPPYHALEIIIKLRDRDFSPNIVSCLLDAVTLYPPNCLIHLNTGELGKVVSYDKNFPTRPRVLVNSESSPDNPLVLDLQHDAEHFIQVIEYTGERNLKILIVDDEQECANALADAIAPAGHQCRVFCSSAQALNQYNVIWPDLVITDVRMPEMDGLTLLKSIRDIDGTARVVLNTGYGDMITVIEAINAGAYGFFLKPVEIPEVMKLLQKAQADLDSLHSRQIIKEALLDENIQLKQQLEQLTTAN